MEKTNIKLPSNIMLKSEYDKAPYDYLPYELLSKEAKDVRNRMKMTEKQRLQQDKSTFYTSTIVDK